VISSTIIGSNDTLIKSNLPFKDYYDCGRGVGVEFKAYFVK